MTFNIPSRKNWTTRQKRWYPSFVYFISFGLDLLHLRLLSQKTNTVHSSFPKFVFSFFMIQKYNRLKILQEHKEGHKNGIFSYNLCRQPWIVRISLSSTKFSRFMYIKMQKIWKHFILFLFFIGNNAFYWIKT